MLVGGTNRKEQTERTVYFSLPLLLNLNTLKVPTLMCEIEFALNAQDS